MSIHNKILFTLCAIISLALLQACGSETPSADQIERPTVVLSDELKATYERTCKHCHEVPQTIAPQTGDSKRWQQILNKGIDTTMDRVMNGFGGMPPAGQCFECSPEEMEQLIYFMAQSQ